MGRGGRGFSRARDVPCKDRAAHMFDLPTRPSDGLMHMCTIADACIQTDAFDALAAIHPGTEGFCSDCNDVYTANISLRIKVQERRERGKRPLARHIAKRARVVTTARNRLAQLQWCDGKFRCVVCFPQGQTRRLSAKRCSNPREHMPVGKSNYEQVHCRAVYTAEELGRVRWYLRVLPKHRMNSSLVT